MLIGSDTVRLAEVWALSTVLDGIGFDTQLIWAMCNPDALLTVLRPSEGERVVTVVAEALETRSRVSRAVELAADPGSVPVVRHLVRDDLIHRGVAETIIDNTLVVITELVSNAVVHARPVRRNGSVRGIIARWDVVADRVEIDVTDGGGPQLPAKKLLSPTDAAGRGLTIVDRLTDSWSVDVGADTVTVHAVING